MENGVDITVTDDVSESKMSDRKVGVTASAREVGELDEVTSKMKMRTMRIPLKILTKIEFLRNMVSELT